MFVPGDCQDCPSDHRLIEDKRTTEQKLQSNVRTLRDNWRLAGNNGERSNKRNEVWTEKSIFRVKQCRKVSPAVGCIVDDTVVSCVNPKGMELISPKKVFIYPCHIRPSKFRRRRYHMRATSVTVTYIWFWFGTVGKSRTKSSIGLFRIFWEQIMAAMTLK